MSLRLSHDPHPRPFSQREKGDVKSEIQVQACLTPRHTSGIVAFLPVINIPTR